MKGTITKLFLLTINSVYEPVASDAEILMLQHVGFMYTLKLSVPQTHAIWRISEVLPTGEDKASNLRKFIEGNLYKIDKGKMTSPYYTYLVQWFPDQKL